MTFHSFCCESTWRRSMNLLVLLVTCCFPLHDPPPFMIVDHVDSIELNHYYDSSGKAVLNQLIYFDWANSDQCFHAIDYRLQKHPTRIPVFDYSTGTYKSWFYDGRYMIQVTSDSFVETWTQTDPEYVQRKNRSNDQRPGLATWFDSK